MPVGGAIVSAVRCSRRFPAMMMSSTHNQVLSADVAGSTRSVEPADDKRPRKRIRIPDSGARPILTSGFGPEQRQNSPEGHRAPTNAPIPPTRRASAFNLLRHKTESP